MHYYIVKTNDQFHTVEYKRYKCIDGFNSNKTLCWKFSKQGAKKIIERLENEYYRNPYVHFSITEAE